MKKIIGLFLVALIPLYVSAGPDNIAPVSYTHLDVYKRQSLGFHATMNRTDADFTS